MKLIITSDLHYGLDDRGDLSTRKLAEEIADSGADALVLAGDNAAFSAPLFTECFNCF